VRQKPMWKKVDDAIALIREHQGRSEAVGKIKS
jgi:hypothetical protein